MLVNQRLFEVFHFIHLHGDVILNRLGNVLLQVGDLVEKLIQEYGPDDVGPFLFYDHVVFLNINKFITVYMIEGMLVAVFFF